MEGVASLKLGSPGVSGSAPVTWAVCTCMKVAGCGEGEGSHPCSSSCGPVAWVLLGGRHILPHFTMEEGETQKDYGLPVPQTHFS